MTAGEITSNCIAVVSLSLATFALWRTNQAERREREAIIVIRSVWSGTPGIDDTHIPPYRGKPAQWIHRNKPPAVAERQLVIAMESRESGVLVRQSDEDVVLVLRASTPNDLADNDGPGGHNTHYVMLEIRNVGRWAATDVRIDCTLEGTFLEKFDEGTIERDFPSQTIMFEALAANEQRYVRIRNMTGLPVMLEFVAVSVGNAQPVRLAPSSPVDFQPRGYRS
jgi:hypothetical protein